MTHTLRILGFALVPLLGLVLAGCSQDALVTWGLNVTIVDSLTGEPLAYGSTLVVVEDAYEEVVRGEEWIHPTLVDELVALNAAEGRTGTYDLTVTHPGYETWHRSDVTVLPESSSPFDASTNPRTVHLVAELQPIQEDGER